MILLLSLLLATTLAAQDIDLTGPWRYHSGDDPRWAQPDFDDSSWDSVILPTTGDWSDGSAYWLRRSVMMVPDHEPMALAFGSHAALYDLYINGRLAGEIRAFQDFSHPRVFAVPNASRVVIAVRVLRPRRPVGLAGALRDEGPYWITRDSHARELAESAWVRLRFATLPHYLVVAIQLGLSLFLLIVWWSTRQRRELLWFSLFLATSAAYNAMMLHFIATGTYLALTRPVLAATLGLLSMSVATLFQVRYGWLWTAASASVTVVLFLLDERGPAFVMLLPGVVWSIHAIHRKHPDRQFSFPFLTYMSILVAATLGVRGLLFYAGPFLIFTTSWVSTVCGLMIITLFLRQLAAAQRDQYRLSAELQAARTVQHMLLSTEATDGVDIAYVPAAEVGGDFYFVVRDGEDLCMVVGDVSGKGLKAAMVVSMILGALRLKTARSPGAILQSLNQVLTGGLDGGFVTSLALRMSATGSLTVANAGHLAPYRGGTEIDLPSGLPLGLAADTAYDEAELMLDQGECLTVISDGVVEAANGKGELFGFDRARALSGKHAKEIAAAAQAWGQNDDITVLTLRRAP